MKKIALIFISSFILFSLNSQAMSINQLLTPGAANTAGVVLENNSGTSSTIAYTEIRFYFPGCSTQMGVTPGITGGTKAFDSGQSATINSSSLFTLANTATSGNATSVGCARIAICSNTNGTGVCNNQNAQCPSVNLSCSGSTCTSTSGTLSITSYSNGLKCIV